MLVPNKRVFRIPVNYVIPSSVCVFSFVYTTCAYYMCILLLMYTPPYVYSTIYTIHGVYTLLCVHFTVYTLHRVYSPLYALFFICTFLCVHSPFCSLFFMSILFCVYSHLYVLSFISSACCEELCVCLEYK